MPIANKYSIERVIAAAKYYAETTGRRVTYEYALIKGVNDSTDNAHELAQRLKGSAFTRWHPYFLDIIGKGNTKQKGIEAICKYFNIKKEDTFAFGDGGNDISMIQYAGTGIAMGNASDDVKTAADIVTDSVDDDGIFNALKKLKQF